MVGLGAQSAFSPDNRAEKKREGLGSGDQV